MSLLIPSRPAAPLNPHPGLSYSARCPGPCQQEVTWWSYPQGERGPNGATESAPVEHVCEPERTEQQQ